MLIFHVVFDSKVNRFLSHTHMHSIGKVTDHGVHVKNNCTELGTFQWIVCMLFINPLPDQLATMIKSFVHLVVHHQHTRSSALQSSSL